MTYVLQGVVEHGDARGRELGFPTANLPIQGQDELDGIWAAQVDVEGHGRYLATVSIGRRPTFYTDAAIRLVEAHILDFDATIYGRHLTVELVAFLRGQERCADVAELIRLITADVAATRQLLAALPA